MWKVVARKDDGKVVWTARPFDNEKEACTYADRVAEEGRNVSDRGEVLKMAVEVEGMKIDEDCINHNVIRFVSDLVSSRYEFLSSENERQDQTNRDYMIMTLGEIGGVLELAEELKKVLKA